MVELKLTYKDGKEETLECKINDLISFIDSKIQKATVVLKYLTPTNNDMNYSKILNTIAKETSTFQSKVTIKKVSQYFFVIMLESDNLNSLINEAKLLNRTMVALDSVWEFEELLSDEIILYDYVAKKNGRPMNDVTPVSAYLSDRYLIGTPHYAVDILMNLRKKRRLYIFETIFKEIYKMDIEEARTKLDNKLNLVALSSQRLNKIKEKYMEMVGC